jgi:hypothetical protein
MSLLVVWLEPLDGGSSMGILGVIPWIHALVEKAHSGLSFAPQRTKRPKFLTMAFLILLTLAGFLALLEKFDLI